MSNFEESTPYDLCVIGAGIAGLNALAVAREYLPKSARVILVDQRPEPGGMWADTYDYVRLHQPHRMFTAGDIKWETGAKPEYLATKPEVQTHLANCLSQCGASYHLTSYFGWEFVAQQEVSTAGGFIAELEFVRKDNNATTAEEKDLSVDGKLRISAKRCIKAFGFRVPQNPPLNFSSSAVHSISPNSDALFSEEFSESTAPCYIVGGGKTAMDTATLIINRYPDKQVNLIVGKGTVFLNRDTVFPQGIKRWYGGETTLGAFTELALKYNGENTEEVFDFLKRKYTLQLDPDYRHYFFGILSEKENETIKRATKTITKDYLVDVEDTGGVSRMIFKREEACIVESGSWFINCTGYIAREEYPYEPYLSPNATIVSVQPTSGIHFLSSFGAYFITHLMFLGKLSSLPLYELDYQDLIRKDRFAFPFVSIAQTMYNVLLIMDVVPMSVMTRCGVDFDNWFPVYRRMLGGAKLSRNSARYKKLFKQTLDTVQRKYDIRCGELESIQVA